MFMEQITNLWTQLLPKMEVPWSSTPRVVPERGDSILGEPPADDDGATKPYVPTNNERVSESSLHFSS